jgi:penicillin-binding protein 1C
MADARWRRRLAAAVAVTVGAALAFLAVPVVRFDDPESAVLIGRNGELLGATVAADEQWRFPAAGAVPERFRIALIAAEDERFWWHPGVDPIAVARATVANATAGEVVSGASTIPMQVVRMAQGNPPRTFRTKVVEGLLALRLSASVSKRDVLDLYARHAPFGGNTVGLDAASWRYFGRAPDTLSWAEAATLAVLPNRPGLIHPGRGRAILLARRDGLLRALQRSGALSEEDLRLALAEPLPSLRAGADAPGAAAPHLLAAARGRVETTLDGELQRRTSEVVARHARALRGSGVHNAAAIVVELESGDVVAYVGNVASDGMHGDQVDIARAARSTGSVLKPFLYEAMLEDGLLSPDQLVPDVPWRFGEFSPENFDRTFEGAVPASEALARSRNVPAVWMLHRYGVDRFADRLRRLGMSTLFRPAADYGLALVVGGAEGSLWDLTGMYRDLGLAVAHPGGPIPPSMHWRRPPMDTDERRPSPFDAGAAWLTLQSLVEVNRPGDLGDWRAFRSSTRVSWKTGTSHGFRDAWAIGITPDYAIGVWVGNADGEGRPDLTGYQAAAPVLFDLFDLVGPAGGFQRPSDALVTVRVCEHSGMLAGPDCPSSRVATVSVAGRRAPVCSFCRQIHCDGDCTRQVTSACATVASMTSRPWFVLPPAMEWFYRKNHPRYRPPPPMGAGCADGAADALAVLYPSPEAAVFVPVGLDGQRGEVVFEASHRDAAAVLYWHLDDGFLGVTRAPHRLAASPAAGDHRLTVVDAAGARATRPFTVWDRTTRAAH